MRRGTRVGGLLSIAGIAVPVDVYPAGTRCVIAVCPPLRPDPTTLPTLQRAGQRWRRGKGCVLYVPHQSRFSVAANVKSSPVAQRRKSLTVCNTKPGLLLVRASLLLQSTYGVGSFQPRLALDLHPLATKSRTRHFP